MKFNLSFFKQIKKEKDRYLLAYIAGRCIGAAHGINLKECYEKSGPAVRSGTSVLPLLSPVLCHLSLHTKSFSLAIGRRPSASQGRWPLAMPGSHCSWTIPAEKAELFLSSFLRAIFRENVFISYAQSFVQSFPKYRAFDWLSLDHLWLLALQCPT